VAARGAEADRTGKAREAERSPAATADVVRATPLVRKLAQEHRVDLATVAGTGPEGRITREDVLRAASDARPRAPAAGPVEYRPFTGRRKQIAQHLVRAKHTAPHASCMEEADVTELVRLHGEQKDAATAAGVRLTYLVYFVRAATLALADHPLLNATLEEDHGRIAVRRFYHIGVAVDAPDGLIVPVVRQADALGLLALAARIQELATRAREGRLEPAEVQDSTFTVSNVGGDGGLLSVGIINYPEVGLLNTHRIEQRPAVVGGEIVIRDRMYLTLTFDHRVIDGVEAVRFLGEVRRRLERPREWAALA